MESTKEKVRLLNSEYVELSKRFSTDDTVAFNISHFLGKAFVSFEYQHYRNYFLREHRFGDKLKMERDCEPTMT
jgi:hypothetical protein